jgi:hypothetical protein
MAVIPVFINLHFLKFPLMFQLELPLKSLFFLLQLHPSRVDLSLNSCHRLCAMQSVSSLALDGISIDK